MSKKITFLSFFILFSFSISRLAAQSQSVVDVAMRYIEQNRGQWNLTESDTRDMLVSDRYVTAHNGITHIYFIQRYENIEVYNAIINVNVSPTGKIYNPGSTFYADMASKVVSSADKTGPQKALSNACAHLNITPEKMQITDRSVKNAYVFDKGNFSTNDIPVRLKYFVDNTGKARLCWDIAINPVGSSDYWSIRVDAATGEILDKTNFTVYCNVEHGMFDQHDECTDLNSSMNFAPVSQTIAERNMANSFAQNQYNVIAFPTEAPIYGARTMVSNPGNPLASPFGWHDTNGVAGPEYTITRGNNVHAYEDVNGTGNPKNDEPEGTADLIFDFPFDQTLEPTGYQKASVTNLFYVVNMMHDLTYAYGFDEVSGNFQANNYGKGGIANDYVRARGQSGQGTNNANFSTPGDGGSGVMNMFLWDQTQEKQFFVDAPAAIEGGYDCSTAQFGATLTSTPITGNLVIVDDGSADPTFGCNDIVNGAALSGNIALIDRGICEFAKKTKKAEDAGAKAVVICNFENALVTMAAAGGFTPTIPAVMVNASTCKLLKDYLTAGTPITVSLKKENATGPKSVDGSFDNGIVAHEFGHGVSTRLTGGPANSGCLNNNEQMGEGWSDFLGLVFTSKSTDNGANPRGIGNYAVRAGVNGRGIRNYPYSTDMNVYPSTYKDIIGLDEAHAIGEIWTAMLWDVYWDMIAKYGFDDDFIKGTKGNNKALQLVMDGMKLQKCSPGFVDGRNAILAADTINNSAENACLLWKSFARRGLGVSANQGLSTNSNDGTEAFDIPTRCINALTFTKSVTEDVIAGEDITVTLRINNYKLTDITNVKVEDHIADGLSFVTGSSSFPVTQEGTTLKFTIDKMSGGEIKEITYRLHTPADKKSKAQFYDGMETTLPVWTPLSVTGSNNPWIVTDYFPYQGNNSWHVESENSASRQELYLEVPDVIKGQHPILAFEHYFNCQPSNDGAFIEVTDQSDKWVKINDKFIRNGYVGKMSYNTFSIPNLQGFFGTNGEYKRTLVDLSEYAGQKILIRFAFGTDDTPYTFTTDKIGWYMDDVFIMDALFYNSEACVTTAQGDQACASAPNKGTLVEAEKTISTKNTDLMRKVSIFPNPASDNIFVKISDLENTTGVLSLMDAQGRAVGEAIKIRDQQIYNLPTNHLSPGLYFVKVNIGNQSTVYKFMKQ